MFLHIGLYIILANRHLDEKTSNFIVSRNFFSGSKEYDVPFDINLRDVNGQTVLYLACCVGNLKIVELLLKYQVKARKVSGKTATLKKKKTGSKDDQSKPSMVATRTSFQTVPTPQQSSIQVSLFFSSNRYMLLSKTYLGFTLYKWFFLLCEQIFA